MFRLRGEVSYFGAYELRRTVKEVERHDELLRAVWRYSDTPVTRSVDNTGARLRRKANQAIGLIVGIPLAFGAGQPARAQLFGIRPTDVGTLVMVMGVMLAVATVAAVIPALRASRVDPATTLRHESV